MSCCPGKRTHGGIVSLDVFVPINATTKRLLRPYQGVVSWKLKHSLKLWSDRGARADSGVWYCYIFLAAVENWSRNGMGRTWNILGFKGYCHFLFPGMEYTKNPNTPSLFIAVRWSLCPTLCHPQYNWNASKVITPIH